MRSSTAEAAEAFETIAAARHRHNWRFAAIDTSSAPAARTPPAKNKEFMRTCSIPYFI
jgi:hypothetical protein